MPISSNIFRKRTRSDFLLALLLTVLCLLAINIAFGVWSTRTPFSRKLNAIDSQSGAEVLFLGNSLLDGRIDGDIFKKEANLIAVNAALGASDPAEHYLLFRYSLERDPKIRQVVIGFYDFQLTDSFGSKLSDLVGNRALALDSRISAPDARHIYHFGIADYLAFRTLRVFPMLAASSVVWQRIELLRRELGGIGMPHQASSSWGRATDFKALEADTLEDFDREANRFGGNAAVLNEPLESIVEEARARKCQVVFLLMPASPYHRGTYYLRPSWKEYLLALKPTMAAEQVDFIDASLWFPLEDQFEDRLHLKKEQKDVLSKRLADALAGMAEPQPVGTGGS